MQFVNADQNLFFNNSKQIPDLGKIFFVSRRYRKDRRAKTLIFDEDKPRPGMVGSSMIQSFVEDLNVNLNLQFIKLKRSFRKLTLKEKFPKRFRKDIPPEFLPKYEDPPNVPKVFKRRNEDGK